MGDETETDEEFAKRQLPIQKGSFEDFHLCPGETIYKSQGTGFYGMHFQGYFNTGSPTNPNDLTMGIYADATIRIRKLKNCFVTNHNLIIGENGKLLAQYGYHVFAPPMDPRKYGMKNKIDRVIRTSQVGDYLISHDVTNKKTGFYIGNTDNFGHWLFEFLPRALWYKRLFPNQEIPLLVGDMVPSKWLDLFMPLGIDLNKIERFSNFSTICYEELIVCSSSCSRLPTGEPRIRLDDFFDIRASIESYFKHIVYEADQLDCLFCTRKNARWRKTVNEDEAIAWLASKFKVEVFEPENLTIKEQLMMLGKTKLFFGAGGSIPFTLFSPHDSILFEIRPPTGHGVVGRCWADMFRFGYHRVAVESVNSKELKSFHEKNLSIDMKKFKKDVDEIVKISEIFK